MGSDDAERVWRVFRESRTPMPPFSDDDVIDFMVREALMLRSLKREKEQAKRQEREEWKRRKVGSGTPGR